MDEAKPYDGLRRGFWGLHAGSLRPCTFDTLGWRFLKGTLQLCHETCCGFRPQNSSNPRSSWLPASSTRPAKAFCKSGMLQ